MTACCPADPLNTLDADQDQEILEADVFYQISCTAAAAAAAAAN